MDVRLPALALVAALAAACSGSDPSSITIVVDDDAFVLPAEQDAKAETTAFEAAPTPIDDATVEDARAETRPLDASDADQAADDARADVRGDVRAEAGGCKEGTIEDEPCGKCGKRSRLCQEGGWLEWGACTEELGECTPGEVRDVACGRCGKRKQTCSATCEWAGERCRDEGSCVAGSAEVRTSGCEAKQARTRTCTETCTWSDWSECQ
jgi:hypothetical protein